jgi:glycosyltransferase involved in cell wall biosynthesis
MMKKEPLVSCIIPTYNREKFLPDSIDSVLKQTYKNWELIIVDDRSTDGTKKLIEKYMKKDKRIKYVKNKHKQGPAGARNQGVELAKGEYIAFLDSDDEWMNFHLSEIIDEMEKNPDVDWIFSNLERYKGKNKVTKSYFNEISPDFLRFNIQKRGKLNILKNKGLTENIIEKNIPAYMQSSIFKRSIFNKIKFKEYILGVDDGLFNIEAVFNKKIIGYINNIHVKYKIHDTNISSSDQYNKSINKKILINFELEKTWKYIINNLILTHKQRSIIKKQLAELYFWQFGYNCYLKLNDYKKTKEYFLKGLKLNPLNLRYLKTYFIRIILKK